MLLNGYFCLENLIYMAGLLKVLKKYREESFSERDKGERFERLMQAYLQTDPLYKSQLCHVWMWNEFPFKDSISLVDVGIDLVAQTFEGEYWAIQCKCYKIGTVIDKPEVDSFLTTSSQAFADDKGNKTFFSVRLWIDTTEKGFNKNAENAIKGQQIPVSRIGLKDLLEAELDWEELDRGKFGTIAQSKPKEPKEHQIEAIEAAEEYYKTNDRGKLIMACGTGKTFTSLKIAEKLTENQGLVLFMVPSIALLGQTLRAWNNDSVTGIRSICVCSDADVSRDKKQNEDADGYSIVDIAMPASTNPEDVRKQYSNIRKNFNGMLVVFSTYQSIECVSQAQRLIGDEFTFDLVVCDEAHRTTGFTLKDNEDSPFVKVHSNENIKARKRLYMTATPRLYSADQQSKAIEREAEIWSMDDVATYGKEFYRIGFGKAVEKHLLTDYKVLVLTLSESQLTPHIQQALAKVDKPETVEIETEDATRLIGCINALSKKTLLDNKLLKESDPEPMHRAVAFCQTIKISKKITDSFNACNTAYYETLTPEERSEIVSVESHHVDGGMGSAVRANELTWLKNAPDDGYKCRILTNVRCLSEGVDVPSLDAVLFLSARNSEIDVVQSVGRVMRVSEGKKYGYIIIPIIVPDDIKPEEALKDNKRYQVVWSVLNALRAHDDRFEATINKIDLNKHKPNNILVGGTSFGGDGMGSSEGGTSTDANFNEQLAHQLKLELEAYQGVIYAKMVEKVGNKRYWEQWASDVAKIAERHVKQINDLISTNEKANKAFVQYLKGLHKNINPSVPKDTAIEMLAQHIITQPVFEALFENYSFAQNNPISKAMGKIIAMINEHIDENDHESLERFYKSVRMRAEGIDNAEAKQKIIVELYDKFFKTAFPKTVEQLGIVYTPTEVVDFIIHSVEHVLNKEFDRSLTDENVNILDPFTGTGTFITRLLQSGIIKPEDLERKYTKEIKANEIVLLAYYIASINIENAYHDLAEKQEYQPFNGICLTDTFQLGEDANADNLFSEMFPVNSKRVQDQKKMPINVVIGNPPYSVGQKLASDNAQNQSYPILDNRIEETYAAKTEQMKRSLYDSYIRAFRWATDRLDKTQGGIIGFVTNGAWLDGIAQDGMRKCLEKEFSSIYVFNLRGNQRTSGELSRKEGGKIFGSGSRTPIAITILVKKPNFNGKATINYHDIGDYLTREQKLAIIKDFGSVEKLPMVTLQPNEHGDWISMRNDSFSNYISLDGQKRDVNSKSYFSIYSAGVITNRESWAYSSSRDVIIKNIQKSIDFYNQEKDKYVEYCRANGKTSAKNVVKVDDSQIKWDEGLYKSIERKSTIFFNENDILTAQYRPFFKQCIYFNSDFNWSRYLQPLLFPNGKKNIAICVVGGGTTKTFSPFISNTIVDRQCMGNGQCFPLYWYEEKDPRLTAMQLDLFGEDKDNGEKYIRHDGVTDYILGRARELYGNKVQKEDIFYYVYGFLHSPEYRQTFEADLKKMLPRIPLEEISAEDFWAFSKAGRALADLHLNYETVEPYVGVHIDVKGKHFSSISINEESPTYGRLVADGSATYGEDKLFYVKQMKFPKKGEKSTIIYNDRITISNIPEEAYEYVVNGKSAIEWIMERYAITTDKASGITNNPNDWSEEHNQPRYIFDLLLRIITVSVKTMEIVKALPKVKFE